MAHRNINRSSFISTFRDFKLCLLYTVLISLPIPVLLFYSLTEYRAVKLARLEEPIQTPPTTASTLNECLISRRSMYVSLCPARMYGNHRTGNHLFMLAAMLYVSERTGRTLIMKSSGWCLDDIFQLNICRFETRQAPTPVRTVRQRGMYNPFPQKTLSSLRNATDRTLALCALYQTYLYADAVEPVLRRQLQFKPEVRDAAELLLKVSRPTAWSPGSYFTVGIHVRRGDFLRATQRSFGLTVISEEYLIKSMSYFMVRHPKVRFVITTDDIAWTKHALARWHTTNESDVQSTSDCYEQLAISNSSVVTFPVGQSVGVDLAVLTACDAVVISTGSFGWWAAWLANKTTIYYSNWPRKGSTFERQLNRKTYFTPGWISMI